MRKKSLGMKCPGSYFKGHWDSSTPSMAVDNARAAACQALAVLSRELTDREVKGAFESYARLCGTLLDAGTPKTADEYCFIMAETGGPVHCLERSFLAENDSARYFFPVIGEALSWVLSDASKQREKVFRRLVQLTMSLLGMETQQVKSLITLRSNNSVMRCITVLDIPVCASHHIVMYVQLTPSSCVRVGDPCGSHCLLEDHSSRGVLDWCVHPGPYRADIEGGREAKDCSDNRGARRGYERS